MKQIGTAALGPWAIALSCADGAVAERLKLRLAGAAGRKKRVVLRCAISVRDEPPARLDVAVAAESSGNTVRFSTGAATGTLCEPDGALAVTVAGRDADFAASAVENIIRAACQRVLVQRRLGILIHAGSAVVAGKAVLFPGASGSGKSTLSRLLQDAGCPLFSDDLSVVLRDAGGLVACGSPFYGGGSRLRRSRGVRTLGGIFFLEHGPAPELLPLSHGLAMSRMITHLPFVAAMGGAAMRTALALAHEIAAQAPAFRFRFTPDASSVAALKNVVKD